MVCLCDVVVLHEPGAGEASCVEELEHLVMLCYLTNQVLAQLGVSETEGNLGLRVTFVKSCSFTHLVLTQFNVLWVGRSSCCRVPSQTGSCRRLLC